MNSLPLVVSPSTGGGTGGGGGTSIWESCPSVWTSAIVSQLGLS